MLNSRFNEIVIYVTIDAQNNAHLYICLKLNEVVKIRRGKTKCPGFQVHDHCNVCIMYIDEKKCKNCL